VGAGDRGSYGPKRALVLDEPDSPDRHKIVYTRKLKQQEKLSRSSREDPGCSIACSIAWIAETYRREYSEPFARHLSSSPPTARAEFVFSVCQTFSLASEVQ
jgi:hypothetical protein